MSSFKNLVHIIHSLKPKEAVLINQIYKCRANRNSLKRLKLFNLIYKEGYADYVDASFRLTKKKPDSGFSHLQRRLFDDILNFILLFPNFEKVKNPAERSEIRCQKLLLQAKNLIERGLISVAIDLLKEGRKLADKYECAAQKLQIQSLLRSFDTSKSKINSEQYTQFIECDITILKAQLMLRNYRNDLSITNSNYTYQQYEEKDDEIRDITKKNLKSRKIWFLHSLEKLRNFINNREFNQSYNVGEELLNALENEPALRTRENIGCINIEVGRILIYLNRYKEAIKHALIATNVLKCEAINEYFAWEVLFFAYFRNEEKQNAQNILNKVQEFTSGDNNGLLNQKWSFYLANLNFSEGNFRQSLKISNNNYMLKNYFLLGSKLLELMNLIELGEFDWFEYKLEAFRKTIYRFEKYPIDRFKSHYQICRELSSAGFDFNRLIDNAPDQIDNISSRKGSHFWDPMGPEFIPFDLWINNKVKLAG